MKNEEIKLTNKHIVIINGNGACGKDTLINYMMLTPNNWVISNFNSIEPVKEIMKKYGYWDGESKNDRERNCMVEIKNALDNLSNAHFIWCTERINKFFKDHCCEEYDEDKNIVLFIHIREPELINDVKEFINTHYNGSFLVKTLLILEGDRKFEWNNNVDNSVKNYNYDLVYLNKLEKNTSCKLFSSSMRYIFQISQQMQEYGTQNLQSVFNTVNGEDISKMVNTI